MSTASAARRPARVPAAFSFAAESHMDADKLGQLIATEERRQSRDAAVAYAGAMAKMAGICR